MAESNYCHVQKLQTDDGSMSLCRHCLHTKRIMMNNPEVLRELLERLTDALIVYVCHQIDSGAQVGHHVVPHLLLCVQGDDLKHWE